MDYVENSHETEERVKRWWSHYGNVISVVIVVIVLTIIGLQYWHHHQHKMAMQASVIYENLLMNIADGKSTQVQSLANHLVNEYDNTIYAQLAAMLLAKQALHDGKLSLAAAKLQWVSRQTKVASIKAIAQVRLARVLLAEKKPQQALRVLQAVTEKNMLALAGVVKGDAYASLQQPQQAKKAYTNALKLMHKTDVLYEYTQMKLNTIAV